MIDSVLKMMNFVFLTQGLPNDQLFFSHLRGAAKQHAAAIWSDISLYVADAVCFGYTCRRLIDLSDDCRYGVQGSKCYDCGHDPVAPGLLTLTNDVMFITM